MRPDLPPLSRYGPALLAESFRVAAATRVVSALVALLAMSVPLAVLGLSGLNIEAQAAILAQLDDVGTRTMTVVSSGTEAAIPAAAVERIARLSGVSWVLGLGPVFDARLAVPAGGPTPVRAYRAVRAPVTFGGTPLDRSAYLSAASAERIGLAGAYGELEPGAIPVVGWFRADEPLGSLDAFILIPRSDDDLLLERVVVAVDDVGWVEAVAAGLPAVLGAGAAGSTTIERSPALLEAREAVRAEVARRDRVVVLALLGAAIVLAAVVVLAGTLTTRRDFGRRRALGATQGQLVALVMLGTLWPALVGVAAGTFSGAFYLGSQLGHLPDWRFPVAVAILATLAVVGASALPAAAAATRDPLTVLRVP